MKQISLERSNFHQKLLNNILLTCNIVLLTALIFLAALSFVNQQLNNMIVAFMGIILFIISLTLQFLHIYELASYITITTLSILSYGALINRIDVSTDLVYLFTSYQSIPIILSGLLATKKRFPLLVGSISLSSLLLYIFTIIRVKVGLTDSTPLIGSGTLIILITILSDRIYAFSGYIMIQYHKEQTALYHKNKQLQDIIHVYQDSQYYGNQLQNFYINTDDLSVKLNNIIQKFITDMHELNQLLKDTHIRNENTINSSSNIVKIFDNHQDNIMEYKNKIDMISETSQDITLIVQNNKASMNQLIELSDQGSSYITDSISAVEKISENSKNMVDMISLIMEVAEKTNILALNAAVEASRAGKYGGGFAIVAKEIKALSTETTQNADIINKSLQDNINSISETVEIIKNIGTSFQQLNISIIKFSSAIDQIVLKMDDLTQQNSQMSIETKNTLSLIREVKNILDKNIYSIQQGQSKMQDIQTLSNQIDKEITTLQQTTSSISHTNKKTQEVYREYSYSVKTVEDTVSVIAQENTN